MDLKTFVEESLSQIVAGVKAAQARPDGEYVAATMHSTGGNLIQGGRDGTFTPVDFDVSVVAETKEGGSSIRVSSAEVKDGSERSAQNSSRVKFTVHLRIPDGGNIPRPKGNEEPRSARANVSRESWR